MARVKHRVFIGLSSGYDSGAIMLALRELRTPFLAYNVRAEEVAAVVRESLSNAVRHAQASSVAVSIAVRGAHVTVTVADDGVGIGPHSRRSGLDNLAARARQRAGEFALTSADPHGTVLSWTVPWEAR